MSGTVKLPVLPLDDEVVLPGMVVPVDISKPDIRAAVESARARADARSATPGIRSPKDAEVLVTPRTDGRYGAIGTRAIIEQVGRLPNGKQAAVVRAEVRMRVGTPAQPGSAPGGPGPGAGVESDSGAESSAWWVEATEVVEGPPSEDGLRLATELKRLIVANLHERQAWQIAEVVEGIEDPGRLADQAGYAPYLSRSQKQQLLETLDVTERLELALQWTKDHIAEQDVADTIRKDVQDGVDKQQREFLLRRQLEAVKKELAELDGSPASEEEDYRARVEAADLPQKVHEAAIKEVEKLERTSEQSPEVGWIRTWLDTVLEMPWNERTQDAYDIAGARAILDADHAGLSDVKDRIIEYLAVRKRRDERGLGVVGGRRSGAVLALVGPPGVGKTSLGESVARAMGRRFVRVALGGVRDEAEIRGHRRTYVGALPGRIVRAIKEAGSMNPVVLLDEVDKLGADYRGDPTAALLEVLDPAQNHTFRDHYLEVELDLSDVLFLATANVLEAIPAPLLDRMELVTLDGYTEAEKVVIGRDHLLPRQRERAGLAESDVTVTDGALSKLAAEYTREAGVRGLERLIARSLRKITAQVALGEAALPVTVDEDNLTGYAGRPHFTPESAYRTALPGVATGLAVTGAGGEVLFVEASLSDPETGASGLTLTGQLGEVMKESAQIALSYLRSHGAELELPVGDLKDRGVHIHVPAGAIPKDGPSAGVTMTTALASLLSGRPSRSDVAMTGEVSLTGRVLPIGGVKQKLLAAHRAGITTVLIPERNEPDLDDVPEQVRRELQIHPVGDVRQVLELALQPATVAAAA